MAEVFFGDVLKSDQVDFVAELVFRREDLVRLFELVVEDVVGAAGLQFHWRYTNVRRWEAYAE